MGSGTSESESGVVAQFLRIDETPLSRPVHTLKREYVPPMINDPPKLLRGFTVNNQVTEQRPPHQLEPSIY
jgi:hypothetical protein